MKEQFRFGCGTFFLVLAFVMGCLFVVCFYVTNVKAGSVMLVSLPIVIHGIFSGWRAE